MFSQIRRHFTYTNIAMTLALLFAMSGGAYAAGKYLITSTKQISPKVLKSLQGKAGARGSTGPAGPAGQTGAAGVAGKEGPGKEGKEGAPGKEGKEGSAGKDGTPGKEGSPWTAGGTLPSEKTETGKWSVIAGEKNTVIASISFIIPLQKALGKNEVHYIQSTSTAECKGTLREPSAEPGNLCVYQGGVGGVTAGHHIVPSFEEFSEEASTKHIIIEGAATSGAIVYFEKEGTGEPLVEGTWAVTAP